MSPSYSKETMSPSYSKETMSPSYSKATMSPSNSREHKNKMKNRISCSWKIQNKMLVTIYLQSASSFEVTMWNQHWLSIGNAFFIIDWMMVV
jgi:maltodextrin utilization protein YvdJ